MALDKSEDLLSYNFSSILKIESLKYVGVHFINTAAISHQALLTRITNHGNVWLWRYNLRGFSPHPNTRYADWRHCWHF